MSETAVREPDDAVSVQESETTPGALVFTFAPAGRTAGNRPPREPRYVVVARPSADRPVFDWSDTPDDPGTGRDRFEQEVQSRLADRRAWVERITALVDQVQRWAAELGWATKRIEKALDDARIGRHRVPALLLQENTCRIILEPVGRAAVGADGLADLYLMPAYDDIASLYFADGGWHIQYRFAGVGDGEARPLTREAVERVLAEMRRHAE